MAAGFAVLCDSGRPGKHEETVAQCDADLLRDGMSLVGSGAGLYSRLGLLLSGGYLAKVTYFFLC